MTACWSCGAEARARESYPRVSQYATSGLNKATPDLDSDMAHAYVGLCAKSISSH